MENRDELPVIEITIDENYFERKHEEAVEKQYARIPEALCAINFGFFRMDIGRKECSKGHLFVNSLSKFCHICGEER